MATQFSGVIYVMGVSGCGKSTVASLIADDLGAPFCEADTLHPQANIERMSKGIPLTDQDRDPWLRKVTVEAGALASEHGSCVVACSCLKQTYRDILSAAHSTVYFIYLQGTYETIQGRMSARSGHFMPDSLLKSQFEALEVPEDGPQTITVSIDQAPKNIALQALTEFRARLSL